VIVELLASQSAEEKRTHAAPTLDRVDQILPGLGTPATVRVAAASPAVGRSLGEIDLRGVTGATVLAIRREEGGVSLPSAREVLHAGDVLALAGSEECVAAARELLAPATAG
jgi:CPA2 family monovalent cation:H+ antiporter-2